MMRDMSLIDKTSDPCRVGLFPLGIGQQTLDACGVYYFGRDNHDSPRRGGMSVEQIKDPQPTPRRGDMYLSITFDLGEVRHFPGEFEQPTCDPCGIGILTFEIIQQSSGACGILPYLYRLNYISPAAFGEYVHKCFYKEIQLCN